MRASRMRPGLAFLGAILVGAALVPADATVREWLMQRVELDPGILRPAPSVRLAGLGEVGLAIYDEANEITTRDYAGIQTGVLEDGDGWVIESWMGGNKQLSDQSALSSERSYGSAGTQAIYRSYDTALGLEYHWTYCEITDTPGDWARVRGPLISAILNRRLGPAIIGGIVGMESENESRNSSDFFAIRHRQERWVGQVGAELPVSGWTLAAAWDFERGAVEGVSADPSRFHEDRFSWSRPLNRYIAAVIFPRAGGFEGALRARLMDRQGGETARISWSAVSPRNPSGEVFLLTGLTTFSEEESDADLDGRIRFRAGPLTLGATAFYRAWEWDVVEGVNYKGSNAEGSWSSDRMGVALGAATRLLGDRVLASVEVRGIQEDWTETADEQEAEGTSRIGLLAGGLEVFLHPDVAVRGGAWLTSQDRDTDAPASLAHGRGVAGGLSWLPNGGTVQFHGSLRHTRVDPWESTGSQAETRETSFAFGLRLLY